MVNFNHNIAIKLNEKNYVIWEQQITSAIRSHKLQGFIDGSTPRPSRRHLYATDATKNGMNEWEQQDQALISWLLASLSDSMKTQVAGCRTSAQVWEKIQVHRATLTRAKVRQYKTELRNCRKENRRMNEYLLRIKVLVDCLTSIGCPVPTQDHLNAILDGLSDEYSAFVISVTTRLDQFTIPEIEAQLLAHEARLMEALPNASTSDAMSSNAAHLDQRQSYNGPRHGRGSGFAVGRGSGHRGRGRSGNIRFNVCCRVCRKPGHTAAVCYHRYDRN